MKRDQFMRILFLFYFLTLNTETCFANSISSQKFRNFIPSFPSIKQNFIHFSSDFLPQAAKQDSEIHTENNKKWMQYHLMFWISGAFSITGGVFLTAGIAMGFIPYHWFPEEMKQPRRWGPYSYMMAYASAGAALFCTGTVLLLFALPFLFYSAVKKIQSKEQNKTNTQNVNWEWQLTPSAIVIRF